MDAVTRPSATWAWVMSYVRLPLAMIGTGIAILAYRLAGHPVGVAAGLGWSTLTMTVANILCLLLLRWRERVEGFTFASLAGWPPSSALADVLWGLLWSLLLGALLLIGIFGVTFALYGVAGLANPAPMFTGDADLSFALPAWLAIVSAVARSRFSILSLRNSNTAATRSRPWSPRPAGHGWVSAWSLWDSGSNTSPMP